jgi:DNA-directed RNA polymerase specialized sigma24 family protein
VGLSPELKKVHEAMYVQGLSQREAAAALGLGRQVVRTLESRLREGLRAALEAGVRSAASPEVRHGPALDAAFSGRKGSVTR